MGQQKSVQVVAYNAAYKNTLKIVKVISAAARSAQQRYFLNVSAARFHQQPVVMQAPNTATGNQYPTVYASSGITDLTYQGHQGFNSAAGPFTVTAADLGAAASNRWIAVCITCTVGGVAATLKASNSAISRTCFIYLANVPSGATGDIVVAVSGSTSCGIGWYRMTGDINSTAIGTFSDSAKATYTNTLTSQAGGVIIACEVTSGGVDGFVTPPLDITAQNGTGSAYHSFGHATTPDSTYDLLANPTGSLSAICAATFGLN
jgi:hypothetical protein